MRFDGHLSDASYEIVDELQIRKKLEERTDWRFEFTKQTKYGYDLELYRWPDDSDRPGDRELIGYFELERADNRNPKSWVTGNIPDGWYFYSILKRKVYSWSKTHGACRNEGCSHQNVEWGPPKKQSHRAIFLKFNHKMDNCFAVPMPVVIEDGKPTKRSVECDPKNSYRRLPLNHEDVRVGVDNVVGFIDSFLNDRQTSIPEYK